MKLTDSKIKEITCTFNEMADNSSLVEIYDGFGGARISINGAGCCNVSELGKLIKDLQALKKAIEDETGLIL